MKTRSVRMARPIAKSAAMPFRADRHSPDDPGLAGKDPKPVKTLQELRPRGPEKKDSGIARESARK